MTAWEIRQYLLACDHYDIPDVALLLGEGQYPDGTPLNINFDKPKRCTERFRGKHGLARAVVRRLAVRDGWVHVRFRGMPYSADQEFCPRHASEGRALQQKEDEEEARAFANS